MTNAIKPKGSISSGVAPTPGDLQVGELGANRADGTLYIKKTDNTIAQIGAQITGVSQIVAGTNITIQPPTGTGVVTVSASGGGGAVTKIIAGNNISIDPTTGIGDVTISSTGTSPQPAASAIVDTTFTGTTATSTQPGTNEQINFTFSSDWAPVIGVTNQITSRVPLFTNKRFYSYVNFNNRLYLAKYLPYDYVLYSTNDGVTWKGNTFYGGTDLNSLYFTYLAANSTRMVVTNGATFFFSTDGTNFQSVTAPGASAFSSSSGKSLWTGTIFVFVGPASNGNVLVRTTIDGSSFTLNEVAFPGSSTVTILYLIQINTTTWTFAGIQSGTIRTFTTTNFTTFTAASNLLYTNLSKLGNTFFNYQGGQYRTSTDFTNWTNGTFTFPASIIEVFVDNAQLIVVLSSGAVYTTVDFTTWVQKTNVPPIGDYNNVDILGKIANNYIIHGIFDTTYANFRRSYITSDFNNYTLAIPGNSAVTNFGNANGGILDYAGDSNYQRQVAALYNCYAVFSSDAGISWQQLNYQFTSIIYNNSQFIAITSTNVYTSVDGLNYVLRANVGGTRLRVFGSFYYIASGYTAYISSNLINWTILINLSSNRIISDILVVDNRIAISTSQFSNPNFYYSNNYTPDIIPTFTSASLPEYGANSMVYTGTNVFLQFTSINTLYIVPIPFSSSVTVAGNPRSLNCTDFKLFWNGRQLINTNNNSLNVSFDGINWTYTNLNISYDYNNGIGNFVSSQTIGDTNTTYSIVSTVSDGVTASYPYDYYLVTTAAGEITTFQIERPAYAGMQPLSLTWRPLSTNTLAQNITSLQNLITSNWPGSSATITNNVLQVTVPGDVPDLTITRSVGPIPTGTLTLSITQGTSGVGGTRDVVTFTDPLTGQTSQFSPSFSDSLTNVVNTAVLSENLANWNGIVSAATSSMATIRWTRFLTGALSSANALQVSVVKGSNSTLAATSTLINPGA